MNCFRHAERQSVVSKSFILSLFFLLSITTSAQHHKSSDSSNTKREVLKTEELNSKISNYYLENGKRALFFMPFAGWNMYDKMFAGAGIFSNPVKETAVRYRFFPSWSFGSDRFQYSGRVSVRFSLNNRISFIEPYIRVQSSAYDLKMRTILNYHFFQAGFDVGFKNRDDKKEKLGFRISWQQLRQEQLQWNLTDSMYYPVKDYLHIFDFKAHTNLLRFANINRQEIHSQFNSRMIKVSFSTFHRVNYGEYKNSLEMRFFAGTFLYNTFPTKDDFRFRLSGIQGTNNYAFDLPYLSRSETGYNFFTNQIYPGDGFFKTAVPLGQNWEWLVSLNLRADFPWKIPLQFYLDMGTYKNAGSLYPGNTIVPWNGGVSILIWKDYIEIFIPLLMSEDINHIYEINSAGFFDRISWMIRFDELNPFKLLKK